MNTIVQPGAACLLPPGMCEAPDRSVEQPFRATSITGPRYREPDARQHVRAGLLAGASIPARLSRRSKGCPNPPLMPRWTIALD
jgi:hypothetical protein